MTLNYLMVRLQFWSSGENELPLYYLYSQVHLPRAIKPVMTLSIDQIVVWKLVVLDKNTWYHITGYKLFVLGIVTWSYNCSEKIIISYLL